MTIPRIEITTPFIQTPEARTNEIIHDYQQLLNRNPSPNEIPIWIGQSNVKAQIAASDEFFIRAGNTPESFINQLYLSVLNRQADPGGLQGWLDTLEGGVPVPINAAGAGGQYWAYAEARNQTKTPLSYAAAGDSITDWFQYGAGQIVWNASYTPLPANDFGISGLGTQEVLWQAEQGQFAGVKALQLLIGTNDLAIYNRTPEQIIATTQNIINHLDPETKVLLIGILPRGLPTDSIRQLIRQTNAGLAQLQSDRVKFFDLESMFMNPGTGVLNSELYMPDGLHLSTAGYALLRALTYPFFVALGW